MSDLTLLLPPASCLAGAARRLRERLGEAAPEA